MKRKTILGIIVGLGLVVLITIVLSGIQTCKAPVVEKQVEEQQEEEKAEETTSPVTEETPPVIGTPEEEEEVAARLRKLLEKGEEVRIKDFKKMIARIKEECQVPIF